MCRQSQPPSPLWNSRGKTRFGRPRRVSFPEYSQLDGWGIARIRGPALDLPHRSTRRSEDIHAAHPP